MSAAASLCFRLGRWLSSLPQQVLLLLVRGYRLLLKPWLGQSCRFEPSCSAYTLEALQRHGASGGVLLGTWRLLRCQPWCHGGCDPVPGRHPLHGLFTRLTATEPPTTTDSPSPNRNLP